MLSAIVAAKGRWACFGTKIKAHTSADDLTRGIVTLAEREGNDRADTYAAYAWGSQAKGISAKTAPIHVLDLDSIDGDETVAGCACSQFLTQAHRREGVYTAFVERLQRMMIAIVKASAGEYDKLVRQHEVSHIAGRRVLHLERTIAFPVYADPSGAAALPRLQDADPNPGTDGLHGRAHLLALVQKFWANIQVEYVQQECQQQGVSWLELTIAFEHEAGIAIENYLGIRTQLDAAMPAKQVVRHFKDFSFKAWARLFDRQVQETILDVDRTRGIRLSNLAVATVTASISCRPLWDFQIQKVVAQGVLAHAGANPTTIRDFIAGNKVVRRCTNLSLAKTPPRWRVQDLDTKLSAIDAQIALIDHSLQALADEADAPETGKQEHSDGLQQGEVAKDPATPPLRPAVVPTATPPEQHPDPRPPGNPPRSSSSG